MVPQQLKSFKLILNIIFVVLIYDFISLMCLKIIWCTQSVVPFCTRVDAEIVMYIEKSRAIEVGHEIYVLKEVKQ